MSVLTRLERRFGRHAIPNLTAGLVLLQAMALVLSWLREGALDALVLIPANVAQGEYWRLISFLATPPSTNWLWAALALYMLYLFGTTLEQKWGDFRYNLYVFCGWLAIVLTSWLHPEGVYGTQFLDLSIFLAFAFLVPDFELLVFFVLPVKVRYLGMFAWALLGIRIFTTPLVEKVQTLALVANFLLFFGRDIVRILREGRRVQQRQVQHARQPAQKRAWHTCATCGATEATRPQDLFVVCSSCTEGREYCSEHLRQHDHR